MSDYDFDELEAMLAEQNAPRPEQKPQMRDPGPVMAPMVPMAPQPDNSDEARAYGRQAARDFTSSNGDLDAMIGTKKRYKPMFETDEASELTGDMPGMLMEDFDGKGYFVPYVGSMAGEYVGLHDGIDLRAMQSGLAGLDQPRQDQMMASDGPNVTIGTPEILPPENSPIDVQIGTPVLKPAASPFIDEMIDDPKPGYYRSR